MKVKDLIKILATFDQDKEIRIEDTEGPFPIVKVIRPVYTDDYYVISSYKE
jgi:hypothetical protein